MPTQSRADTASGTMAARSRSPRRAEAATPQRGDVAKAIRVASRSALERYLLKCFEAGGMPEEVRSALLPPDVQPRPMIHTTLSKFRVKLPTCIFGAMLTQRVKISLQSVSRQWRDVVRMPSMWLALSCRSLRGNAKQFLAHLKDARFAQVKALALPTNKLTLDLCAQLQRHLPQVSAIDATKSSCWGSGPLEALREGFASLLHLRLSSYSFDAACLRKLLARHGDLRALEVLAPAALCTELGARTFGGALEPHCALETLSLDFGSSHNYRRDQGFDFPAACDELTQRILARLPNLKRLCLNRWSSISDANVDTIVRACPNLVELRLAEVPVGGAHAIVTRAVDWKILPLAEAGR